MASPTEIAQNTLQTAIANFNGAALHLHKNQQMEGLGSMATGLQQTAWALQDLCVGVRATYILLAEVKRMLEQQQQRRM